MQEIIKQHSAGWNSFAWWREQKTWLELHIGVDFSSACGLNGCIAFSHNCHARPRACCCAVENGELTLFSSPPEAAEHNWNESSSPSRHLQPDSHELMHLRPRIVERNHTSGDSLLAEWCKWTNCIRPLQTSLGLCFEALTDVEVVALSWKLFQGRMWGKKGIRFDGSELKLWSKRGQIDSLMLKYTLTWPSSCYPRYRYFSWVPLWCRYHTQNTKCNYRKAGQFIMTFDSGDLVPFFNGTICKWTLPFRWERSPEEWHWSETMIVGPGTDMHKALPWIEIIDRVSYLNFRCYLWSENMESNGSCLILEDFSPHCTWNAQFLTEKPSQLPTIGAHELQLKLLLSTDTQSSPRRSSEMTQRSTRLKSLKRNDENWAMTQQKSTSIDEWSWDCWKQNWYYVSM